MNAPRSEYTKWYKTAAWQKRRRAQLNTEPLCRECNRIGILTPATVADHIERHSGDVAKFWEGELQSLCRSCHNSFKQRVEKSGRAYSTVVGLDGWPINGPQRRIRFEVDQLETALNITARGKGVLFCPSFVVRRYNELVRDQFQLEQLPYPRRMKSVKMVIYLVRRRSMRLSGDIQLLTQAIRQCCA